MPLPPDASGERMTLILITGVASGVVVVGLIVMAMACMRSTTSGRRRGAGASGVVGGVRLRPRRAGLVQGGVRLWSWRVPASRCCVVSARDVFRVPDPDHICTAYGTSTARYDSTQSRDVCPNCKCTGVAALGMFVCVRVSLSAVSLGCNGLHSRYSTYILLEQ